MIFKVFTLFWFILLTISTTSYAATRYWIATVAGNWNTTANWSNTSGGGGGFSVPGSADVVIFNGTGGRNGNCTLTTAITIAGITINGYTGTINLNGNNLTITTGTNTLTFTTGTVNNTGAAGSIILNTTTACNFSGTTFGANTSGTTGTMTFTTSTFNGTADLKAANVFLNGSTFNAVTRIEKTGTGDDAGTGGNRFNGTTTLLVNSSAGSFESGNVNFDIFNTDLTLTNTGPRFILMADASAGNQFNGNIIVNSTAGLGVSFASNAGATATLAAGKTLTVGATGFSVGALYLTRFIQLGTTAQNITVTGSSAILLGPVSTFNADVSFKAPEIQLNGCTFNGTTTLEQTGTSGTTSAGGNVFNGTTSLINSGTGAWLLANTTGDTYNGAVTFSQLSTGALQPAYNQTSNFYSNVTITSATAVIFGTGAGIAQFSGGNNQTLAGSGSIPIIQRLTLNKTAGSTVTLTTPVTIGTTTDFTSGIINTTTTNYLNFAAGSTVTGTPGNTTYISGPVRKTGNSAFTFPVGKSSVYAPVSIGAPGALTDVFTAEYFKVNPGTAGFNRSLHVGSINHLSSSEYWTVNRTTGTSNVAVTLSWNVAARSGGISNLAELTVGRWDGVTWQNEGNGGTTGTTAAGTIVTAAAVSSFGPFTLASTTVNNPLPIKLTAFNAHWDNTTRPGKAILNWTTAFESNNHYFDIERSEDLAHFTPVARVYSKGNTGTGFDYSAVDQPPLQTGNYQYRLKQVDLDGQFFYSPVVRLKLWQNIPGGTLWPNPAVDEVNCIVTQQANQLVTITVADVNGKVVTQTQQKLTDDSARVKVSTQQLPDGIYFIKLTSSAGKLLLARRFMILR